MQKVSGVKKSNATVAAYQHHYDAFGLKGVVPQGSGAGSGANLVDTRRLPLLVKVPATRSRDGQRALTLAPLVITDIGASGPSGQRRSRAWSEKTLPGHTRLRPEASLASSRRSSSRWQEAKTRTAAKPLPICGEVKRPPGIRPEIQAARSRWPCAGGAVRGGSRKRRSTTFDTTLRLSRARNLRKSLKEWWVGGDSNPGPID